MAEHHLTREGLEKRGSCTTALQAVNSIHLLTGIRQMKTSVPVPRTGKLERTRVAGGDAADAQQRGLPLGTLYHLFFPVFPEVESFHSGHLWTARTGTKARLSLTNSTVSSAQVSLGHTEHRSAFPGEHSSA